MNQRNGVETQHEDDVVGSEATGRKTKTLTQSIAPTLTYVVTPVSTTINRNLQRQ